MVSVRKKKPNYSLCNQVVTVYHANAGTYTRTVINKAFFDFKKVENVDKTGSKESNSFMLVIPAENSSVQPVFNGDKVFMGEGPLIASKEAWAAFIPSRYTGLVVISYVDPKYFNGVLVHWEAGG